jgi:heat shock protein HtpX
MARQWYGRDTGLTVRMFLTMFLLMVVYLAFLALLWYLGIGTAGLIVIAAILVLAQYFLSDKLVLWSTGAKIVTPTQAPELHSMIDRLAASVNLPKPRVAIIDTAMPNAFATGRSPKNSVVAVTTGLMNRLSNSEVEAVLAHEMSHVKNRDVMVITLASFLSTLAFILMRAFMFSGMGYGMGRGRRDQGGQVIILIYMASLLVWIISFFLIRAISRYREYAADRGSAIITGAPSLLSSALLKISSGLQRIPDRDLREVGAMNAFFIVPAVSKASIMELFSTHPSLEHRLARLEKMQQQMEGV